MILGAVGTATPGNAYLVEGVLTGTVEAVEEPYESLARIGTSVRLSYAFDSDAPDFMPQDATIGAYHISSARLQLGSLSIQTTPADTDSAVIVRNFYPLSDQYLVYARFSSFSEGLETPVFATSLEAYGTRLYLDDALRTDINHADFDYRAFTLESQHNPGAMITGTINSLSFSVIPEPGSAIIWAVLTFQMLRRRPRQTP